MLDLLAFEDLVFEDVAVVLEEVDVANAAVTHTEMHWLVGLRVLYSFDHCNCLGLSPVP